MTSKKSFLAICLFCAGCAQGAQADLQYIKQARSLAAEWALVNELDAQHRLNRTYVDSMHRWLADDLETVLNSLSEPNSDYGAQIKALSDAPPGIAAADLRSRSETLKRIEDRLESA